MIECTFPVAKWSVTRIYSLCRTNDRSSWLDGPFRTFLRNAVVASFTLKANVSTMCNTTSNGTKSQSNPNNDTSLSTTHVYLLIWCLHLLQPWADEMLFGKGSGGLDSRPLMTADYKFLLPAIVATLIFLSTCTKTSSSSSSPLPHHVIGMALVCHAVDLVIRFDRLPAVWDHEIWGLLINFSFSVCFLPALLSSRNSSTSMIQAQDDFLRLTRLQLALFYAAATFWKLNSSFFNPQTSCGTILILELIGAYTWGEIPPKLVELLVAMAPHLTLLLEATIAAGMLYTSWGGLDNSTTMYCRDATVLLTTVFHLLIFIMPVNSAGGFSLECLTRLVLFFDAVEVDRVQQWIARCSPWKLVISSILVTVTLIAWRYMATRAPFDVGFAFAGLLLVLYCLILGGHGGIGGTGTSGTTRTKVAAFVQSVVLILTVTYTFLTPVLGLMQMSAPTMYANLRSYNGGNHYLVPTAILGEDILYGGGLVQVLNSTSWSVNLLLAYITSKDVFPKRVVDMLQPQIRQSNNDYEHLPLQLFPMCVYNPHSREVLMEDYRASNAANSSLLAPFIIPRSTLRQTLKEANEHEESFIVEFSKSLEPNPSAYVRIDSSGECKVILNDSNASDDCSSSRIAQRVLGPQDESGSSFWKALVDKLLVPYPEIVGMAEEICMS